MNEPSQSSEKTFRLLISLYGEAQAKQLQSRIDELIQEYSQLVGEHPDRPHLSHADAFLITYGDQVLEHGTPSLQSLAAVCDRYLKNVITAIHILPFFPYSSDDGFSVIDYRKVDPPLGDWVDVQRMRADFKLMFDAVINHVSIQHSWFQGFLAGDTPYENYFVVVTGAPDLSAVVRPRTLPLLTEFATPKGAKQVWTTFSEDQVDLNFSNPEVLLEILDLLLSYAAQGASFLRLDAVGYLWKEPGTNCIHLPQTHRIIQLIRGVLDQVAPPVSLITETNVPHADNISYFGDGKNEAQLVYNFALPPLVLHTLHSGDSTAITRWAASLKLPSSQTTFFNFLASHDGIGVNPVRGILNANEIDAIVAQCRKHGGLISYKRNPDGTESPYELNINYFDALSDPASDENIDLQIDRFVAAHAILLAMIGVPAIYFHSLFGSRNWVEGPAITGRNRSINREKLQREKLEALLADHKSLRSKVFHRLRKLLEIRAQHLAFDPYGEQEIQDYGETVFAVRRTSSDGKERVLCLQNITAQNQTIQISGSIHMADLLNAGDAFLSPGPLVLSSYQTAWLAEDSSAL